MICVDCAEHFSEYESDKVHDNFGSFDDIAICFDCAVERWEEHERNQAMSDVVQDGPCS